MAENQESNSLGGVLEQIAQGDVRKRIYFDETTGEFVLEDNGQDVTDFAGEGFA